MRDDSPAHARAQAPARAGGLSSASEAPLSFAQRRIWFLEEFEGGDPVFNLRTALRLLGPLDDDGLCASLDLLVARHAALRTTFGSVDGTPVQRVSEARPFELGRTDLSGLADADRAAELRRLFVERSREAFDLSLSPLIRGDLFRLQPDEHVLLLVMHHIAADGWSTNLLLHELATLYGANCADRSEGVPDPELQYVDFAARQHEQWGREGLAAQLEHWKRHLAGAPPVLELPSDHPRPRARTSAGARWETRVPAQLAEALRELGRAEGCTTFMVLLAAYATLLSRYTGEEDVVVGAPIAGRNRAELEGIVGFFVNTLALRIDLSERPTWREVLRRVRKVTLSAYANQDLPFEKLVEELQPPRTLSHTPLFQTMLAFQNVPGSAVDFHGLTAERVDFDCGTSNFNVSLFVDDVAGDTIRLTVEYSTELFEAETIERFTEHFGVLLQGIVERPDARLSELPLLPPAGQQELLVGISGPQVEPEGGLVHEMIEAQVDRSPEVTAIAFGEHEISYRELEDRANRAAHHLRSLGIGHESVVGILLERSPEMVVAVLGVLKAGAAYLPLDPGFPEARLAFMLRDAGAAVVLTQESLRPAVAAWDGRLVSVDGDREAIREHPDHRLDSGVAADHLSYVIYTSGSTGQPKGVQIEHGAVANLLSSLRRNPGVVAADRWLAVTTLSFDISVPELLLPLTVGARVVLASREVAGDGRLLLREIERSGATIMQATPASWHMLLAAGWEGTPRLKVLCGGEALSEDLAAQLVRHAESVWNMYGPTEATVWSSLWRVPDDVDRILIGKPIANTTMYVLDEQRGPVPPGVAGEIYIGGDGVGRGYQRRPGLSAEHFVSDPFDAGRRRRLYRTGDLGRCDRGGNVEFIRRMDDQAKVRGFRIELGEIESVLAKHPAVQQAVATVQEISAADRRLVVFFVPAPHLAASVTALRRHARLELPDYMIPQYFVELDSLPVTESGKIDRRALPRAFSIASSAIASVAPRTRTERLVAEIWGEALGVDGIGVHDNFFDLGGHSLLSAQVIARIEKATGAQLSLRTIMLDTLEQLAAAVAAR